MNLFNYFIKLIPDLSVLEKLEMYYYQNKNNFRTEGLAKSNGLFYVRDGENDPDSNENDTNLTRGIFTIFGKTTNLDDYLDCKYSGILIKKEEFKYNTSQGVAADEYILNIAVVAPEGSFIKFKEFTKESSFTSKIIFGVGF